MRGSGCEGVWVIVITQLCPQVLRPPLKKCLFPVQRPGENIRADWDLFFLIFDLFFFKNFSNFLQKKKNGKKKNLRPTEWPWFGPPATQETNFFLRVAS